MTLQNRSSLWPANTLTAGAANQETTPVNLTGKYGALVTVRITNGATGPTVAASCSVLLACDAAGTVYGEYASFTAGTANNAVYTKAFSIPIGCGAIKLSAGGNTVQNVTITADICTVDGV